MAKTWKARRHKTTGEIMTGHYFLHYSSRVEPSWEEVEVPVLDDVITYQDFGRGRSSAAFYFQGRTQNWVTGMKGMARFIPLMVNGVYHGKITLMKQGMEVYVCPVPKDVRETN